jgi:hypothetical protein
MDTQATIQARIEAHEQYAAIDYGIRAMDAMGGWRGCTTEFAGAGWAIAQFEAGIIAAAEAIGKDDIDAADMAEGAAWLMKRGKKAAFEARKAANEAEKAAGTMRQRRMALAA